MISEEIRQKPGLPTEKKKKSKLVASSRAFRRALLPYLELELDQEKRDLLHQVRWSDPPFPWLLTHTD